MHSVQMTAGCLSVSVQTDEDVSLSECASLCHQELRWEMEQFTTVSGEMVGIEQPGFTMGDD